MSNADLTAILNDLAAGRIDAAEAARRIDAAKTEAAAEAPPPGQPAESDSSREQARSTDGWFGAATPPSSPPPGVDDDVPPSERRRRTDAVDRISVRAVGRRVRIVGDYSVTTVAAEGPHVLRRNGSVMEVSSDGEIGPSLDGFSMLRPPRSLDDIRAMSLGKELFIRVNPHVVVDAEISAGSLTTSDVPYLGKVRVTAGAATLANVAEVSDALVQAGSCSLQGSIRTGRNRVRCESGSVVVELATDSNVTVEAEAQLGRVHFAGQQPDAGKLDQLVLGNGSARLDVDVVMGHAAIRVEGQS